MRHPASEAGALSTELQGPGDRRIESQGQSAMIPDPITMDPDQKISEALEVMRKYNINGIPITQNKKLVGILTTL